MILIRVMSLTPPVEADAWSYAAQIKDRLLAMHPFESKWVHGKGLCDSEVKKTVFYENDSNR